MESDWQTDNLHVHFDDDGLEVVTEDSADKVLTENCQDDYKPLMKKKLVDEKIPQEDFQELKLNPENLCLNVEMFLLGAIHPNQGWCQCLYLT